MSGPKLAEWPRPAAEEEIRAVLERARRGEPDAVPALRRALDGHPEIWRAYGDLAAHARDAWIGLTAGPDLALKESLARRAAAMREEVAGPSPSPLESLLAERVVACWLQVGYCDAAAAQAGEVSVKQAEHARKRQDSAHRRYVTAIGALATLRRLLGLAGQSADPLRGAQTRLMMPRDAGAEAEVGAVRLAVPGVGGGGP